MAVGHDPAIQRQAQEAGVAPDRFGVAPQQFSADSGGETAFPPSQEDRGDGLDAALRPAGLSGRLGDEVGGLLDALERRGSVVC
jgi:hypothetical protein